MKISKDMTISELLSVDNGFVPILMNAGMHCVGCPSSLHESIAEAAMVHGIDVDELVNALNAYYESTK